jgi:hypothetical protein
VADVLFTLGAYSSSSSMALQPGVGLGLHSNPPSNLSIPCSVSPFVYSHLSQVRRHVIQPSRFWSSSAYSFTLGAYACFKLVHLSVLTRSLMINVVMTIE